MVDVLQMLAVALTLLQLLTLAVRRPGALAGCCTGAGLAFVALTPLMRSIDWGKKLRAPLAAYLHAGSGSIFPLFGWACFPFLGAALAVGYHRQAERAPALLLRRGLVAAGLLVHGEAGAGGPEPLRGVLSI